MNKNHILIQIKIQYNITTMRNNKYNSYAFPTNQLKIHFALKIITLEVLHVDVIGRHNPRSETCYGKYPTQVRFILASELA